MLLSPPDVIIIIFILLCPSQLVDGRQCPASTYFQGESLSKDNAGCKHDEESNWQRRVFIFFGGVLNSLARLEVAQGILTKKR